MSERTEPTADWGAHRFSTRRTQPSSMLTWALENWRRVHAEAAPRRALHVGCGTGRNAAYLAGCGIEVVGFDSSERALELAAQRLDEAGLEPRPALHQLDLRAGLPRHFGVFDLVIDVFVYNEQIDADDRRRYRDEVRALLAPGGLWLLGVPALDDGFYASCADLESADARNLRTVRDAEGDLGVALFTFESLLAEVGDAFECRLAWRQVKQGLMYGRESTRRNLALLWQVAGST